MQIGFIDQQLNWTSGVRGFNTTKKKDPYHHICRKEILENKTSIRYMDVFIWS